MTPSHPERPPKSFTLLATDGGARTGVLATARGEIRTPAFMPVGTAGTVKALTVDQVAVAGADVILGNTYHLMLRPGPERLQRLGGLHRFMRWDGPILTDSGGFQVMSLSNIAKMSEEAVTFASHIDGSRHALSPRALHRDPGRPHRGRHRHAARRVRGLAGGRGARPRGHGALRPLGRALQGGVRPA